MLSGHAISVRDFEPCSSSDQQHLLANPVSELDENESKEEEEKILYIASFEELATSYLKYDTIIWVLISLLLILAWGVGIIMLIYLPIRRYVLRKDISSRRLYVTPIDIVYKVSRPLFLPFFGVTKIEKRIPLRLVIDIIMEQGCLQSRYGLHTFRVQSIAYGIAAPVDELQVQGVSNPEHLRKVIVTEASKIQLVGRDWKKLMIEGPHDGRSASSNWKDGRGTVPAELVLHKLDEVNQSVKRIESLIGKPQAVPGSN